MGNPTAFQGAGGLHTAWATNPFSTYGNKLSCSGSAFPWPRLKHYHPGLHRLSSKVASTIIFPGLKDVRIEGHLVPQQTRRKKTDSMRQLCSILHCISRKTQQVEQVPRFIARAKSNWTSCIITSSSATSTLPGRPVLTSTRLHTNRKYQNCKSQRKKCLPTSWSLSLTLL